MLRFRMLITRMRLRERWLMIPFLRLLFQVENDRSRS